MDQNTLDDSGNFVSAVKEALGRFLEARGYRLETVKTADSALETTIVYTSPVAKIAVYRSTRQGEVNCLIGGAHASTEDIEKPAWQYLTRLLLNAGRLTRADLLARTQAPPRGWDLQLNTVADELTTNLGLLEK